MPSTLADAWRLQIAYCDAHGSPFTARVLEAAWADWQQGGALRGLLPDWPGDAWLDAVPLRVAAALHSLALDGSDAALAALYPPAAAAFDTVRGATVVRDALREHAARVAHYLTMAPQTNEIGRSAVLYHSIVWQYLPLDARRLLRDTIEAAGARATRAAPLAWLALEPPDASSLPQLTLTQWPGGEHRVLADAHADGLFATWLDVQQAEAEQ